MLILFLVTVVVENMASLFPLGFDEEAVFLKVFSALKSLWLVSV
jgi:hypothetical protein